MKLFLVLGLSLLLTLDAAANNLAVSNVLVGGQDAAADTYNISYDVSWDNSWFIAGAPASNANWDAAWVFAKFRVYNTGTATWGDWAHCTMSKTAANHTAPTGSQITVGCSPAAACGGGDTGKGIFIYRNAAGTGSVSWAWAALRWLYGTDGVGDSDRVQVRVFAMEMVYVPTAVFYIGDGSANPAGNFKAASGGGAVQVGSGWSSAFNSEAAGGTDDDAQLKDPGAGLEVSGTGGLRYADDSNVNASFPAGYNAFYIMKYDASQRQYAHFLNTLTRTQQNNRVAADVSADAPSARYVMSASNAVEHRSALAAPASGNGTTAAIVFGTDLNANETLDESADGGWETLTGVSWMDAAAYLAWSGLRPMSELEFEKAARGPTAAAADEYAWGDISLYNTAGTSDDYALSSSGESAEGVSNAAAGTGNALFYPTSCMNGPNNVCAAVRNGIFAASAGTKNRQETGGSYYGVMDLSGGVWKYVVTVGNTTGRAFNGAHGTGALSAAGYAALSTWPGYSGSEVTTAAGSGFKGGSWMNLSTSLRVSDRGYASAASTVRSNVYGIRGVHTAP